MTYVSTNQSDVSTTSVSRVHWSSSRSPQDVQLVASRLEGSSTLPKVSPLLPWRPPCITLLHLTFYKGIVAKMKKVEEESKAKIEGENPPD